MLELSKSSSTIDNQGVTPMVFSSSNNTRMSSIGINALNKVVRAMLGHPIINIGFQAQEEIKDTLQPLENLATNKVAR